MIRSGVMLVRVSCIFLCDGLNAPDDVIKYNRHNMFTLLSAWYKESTNATHGFLIYNGLNFIEGLNCVVKWLQMTSRVTIGW